VHEVVAAVLFLLSPTVVVGGWALLVIFAAAALLHFMHGQFEVGGLLVYGAAVFVVLAFREPTGSQIDARVAQR